MQTQQVGGCPRASGAAGRGWVTLGASLLSVLLLVAGCGSSDSEVTESAGEFAPPPAHLTGQPPATQAAPLESDPSADGVGPCTKLDSDGDGVNDCDDKCPNTTVGDTVVEGPFPGCDRRIRVKATREMLTLPFAVDLHGAGSDFVGEFDIADNFGTVELGGEILDMLVYERTHWDEIGYDLYQGLAVASDRWFALWFYCDGARVEWVFYEGTDGTTLQQEMTAGACVFLAKAHAVSVGFPSVDMSFPEPLAGYRIDGRDIELEDDGVGQVNLPGGAEMLLPFAGVDCSACPGGSWYEVHSILWNPVDEKACFAMLYLSQAGGPIVMAYSICLPGLTNPTADAVGRSAIDSVLGLDASWSVPKEYTARLGISPATAPPPSVAMSAGR